MAAPACEIRVAGLVPPEDLELHDVLVAQQGFRTPGPT